MSEARIGIAVWLNAMKQARQLRKYGTVHYISKKMNYAILYCAQSEVEEVKEKLQALPFVTKVELSMKPKLRTTFSGRLHPRETEERKTFNYNMGL
ncbi:YlbG family protein [Bacillus piscicola]|uniref:YlbG family protein n=1 Tax=Bacillus piscicola TaxID=1632684 RepID=UPI001F09778B|nr:YlbG family protein [Bacillus piscicola]